MTEQPNDDLTADVPALPLEEIETFDQAITRHDTPEEEE